MSLVWQLFASTLLVAFTALLHLAGLAGLIALLQAHGKRVRTPHVRLNQALLVLIAVFALIALHGIEIWLYAAVYTLVGEFPAFEDALYFSTSTYATIGYGDLVLSPAWRIVGAIEGVNGIILLGWSTAFFVSIVGRLAELERNDPP
ncbi:potassium channel family protein [Phenylobacterium sp. LH3H17]|uniref:potassium channel family protein n=1 Tax=Phenylobacterium sp. LH3H17 TaxID=2903901 RepID=UPI0020C9A9C5|nr:potassium channel family protein [Phenylobacterium sp. LH3H17]UTP38039.1 potassium channel family protein [Phenylobacterium sp. LH3H17]